MLLVSNKSVRHVMFVGALWDGGVKNPHPATVCRVTKEETKLAFIAENQLVAHLWGKYYIPKTKKVLIMRSKFRKFFTCNLFYDTALSVSANPECLDMVVVDQWVTADTGGRTGFIPRLFAAWRVIRGESFSPVYMYSNSATELAEALLEAAAIITDAKPLTGAKARYRE